MEHQTYEIITSEETDGVKVDVVAYRVLKGSADPRTAETLFFAAQAGMRLKMVRIVLNNSSVRLEPGALYHNVWQLRDEDIDWWRRAQGF